MTNARPNRTTRFMHILSAIVMCLTNVSLCWGQLPQTGEGVVGRATGRLSDLNLNGPGYLYYGINGADRGLGYVGSYMTLGGFIPTLEDDFGGIWNADVRGHLSVNSGFFSNVGAVRKQLLNNGSLLGIGIFWDYDGDLYQYPIEQADEPGAIFGAYGHVFQQVGISGEWLTDWGNIRTNGYIPVGTTGNQLVTSGTATGVFYQSFILPQNGLSAALGGADFELGAYVPALADWAGMINVGGYAYGNSRYTKIGGVGHGEDLVPWFGGVYTRLDMTFANNWDFSLQYNNDSFFNSTGFARLTYRIGGSRRRNVPDQMEQPMFRNEHIVRASVTPIATLNPQNNNLPWRVVHVDNQAGPNGNGTVESPLRTLAEAQNPALTGGLADQEWTITYVQQGNATTTFDAYTDEFIFRNDNQFLVGSGGPLTIATQPMNGSSLLTVGALTAGNPVLNNNGGSSITIRDDVGGVTIANISTIGSNVGIDASGNLSSGIGQPAGTTANPFGTAIANAGGSAVRNVSISGDGTNDLQKGVRIAGIVDPATGNTTTSNPTGGIEFSDTSINITTAQAFQVGAITEAPAVAGDAILGSGGDVSINYLGSITNNISQNGNFPSVLVTVLGKTGGTVNITASGTPLDATVENKILDVGGQGILIEENDAPTFINIGNATLADNTNTAIFVLNDSSTTNITAEGNATYASGISKRGGQSAIFIEGGSPQFTYFGTIENSAPTGAANRLTTITDVNNADINISGPGILPLVDAASGVGINNATTSTIQFSGLDLRGPGDSGIEVVEATNSTISFTDVFITGATQQGILLDGTLGSPTTTEFTNTFINLAGASHGVRLESFAGPSTFTSLTAITANAGATAFATTTAQAGDIAITGNSILQSASTTQPALQVNSTDVNMTFSSITSGVPNAAGIAVDFTGTPTGTFQITDSFQVGGADGSPANITPGGVTIAPLP